MVLLEKKFCFLNIMKIVASPWSVDIMLQICGGWLFVYVLFLIKNGFLKHKQAKISIESRRFGVIMTPFSRQSE